MSGKRNGFIFLSVTVGDYFPLLREIENCMIEKTKKTKIKKHKNMSLHFSLFLASVIYPEFFSCVKRTSSIRRFDIANKNEKKTN